MKKFLLLLVLSLNLLALTKEQENFIRAKRQDSMNMEFWSETREIGTIMNIFDVFTIVKLNENVYTRSFWITIEAYTGEKLSNYPNIIKKLEMIDGVKFFKNGKSLILPTYHSPRYYSSDDVQSYILDTEPLTKEQESFILNGGYSIQLMSNNKVILSTDVIEDNSVSDLIYKEILKESNDKKNVY